MSAKNTLQPIQEIFADFNKLAEKLDKIPESAKTKTTALLTLFFDQKNDIFNDPQKFLEGINDLSEEVGHAYHTVLSIELARQRINPQKKPKLVPLERFRVACWLLLHGKENIGKTAHASNRKRDRRDR